MSKDLVVQRKHLMAKLFATLTTVMVVPPVLAAVFGSLGLAVVVGILSIFTGLIGMSLVVSKWEFFQRRVERAALPKARLLDKKS